MSRPGSDWQGVWVTGAIAAATVALFVPVHLATFAIWPPPLDGTAVDWFRVFASSRLLGLLSMDLLLMLDYALLAPIYLGLYLALRRHGPSATLIGVGLGLLSMAIYFASNPALEMLALSGRYAAAATDAERALWIAAGEATVVRYQGTAFHTSYVLGSIAGTLVSVPMLRSPVFGRVAGWAGIVGNVVGFGLYLPVVGLALGVVSGPVLWVWFILVARGFVRLARGVEA